MKWVSKFTILKWIILLLLVGCSSGQQNWTEFPPYPDAKDIRTYNLKRENARQISFVVDVEYPDRAVVDFYSAQINRPWTRCFSEAQWQLYDDTASKTAAFVHQILVYWVNFEQDRLLLLAVRYESEGEKYRQVPEGSKQHIDLAEYREANVEEAINRLGLVCERT